MSAYAPLLVSCRPPRTEDLYLPPIVKKLDMALDFALVDGFGGREAIDSTRFLFALRAAAGGSNVIIADSTVVGSGWTKNLTAKLARLVVGAGSTDLLTGGVDYAFDVEIETALSERSRIAQCSLISAVAPIGDLGAAPPPGPPGFQRVYQLSFTGAEELKSVVFNVSRDTNYGVTFGIAGTFINAHVLLPVRTNGFDLELGTSPGVGNTTLVTCSVQELA
jgi:hypothetical protein